MLGLLIPMGILVIVWIVSWLVCRIAADLLTRGSIPNGRERRKQASRVQELRGIGHGWVFTLTLGIVYVYGIWESLRSLLAPADDLALVPSSFLLAAVIVTYGPLLIGLLGIYLAVLPFDDEVNERPRTRKRAVKTYFWNYVGASAFILGLVAVTDFAPSGMVAGLGVTLWILGYAAAGPALLDVGVNVRGLTGEERTILNGVDETAQTPLYVVEGAHERAAYCLSVGIVPGYQTLLVTDYLLEELEPEETRTAVAYVYGMLRREMPLQKWILLATYVGASLGVILTGLWGFLLALVGLVPYVAVWRWLDRRQKREAEQFVVQQTDAEGIEDALENIEKAFEKVDKINTVQGVFRPP